MDHGFANPPTSGLDLWVSNCVEAEVFVHVREAEAEAFPQLSLLLLFQKYRETQPSSLLHFDPYPSYHAAISGLFFLYKKPALPSCLHKKLEASKRSFPELFKSHEPWP